MSCTSRSMRASFTRSEESGSTWPPEVTFSPERSCAFSSFSSHNSACSCLISCWSCSISLSSRNPCPPTETVSSLSICRFFLDLFSRNNPSSSAQRYDRAQSPEGGILRLGYRNSRPGNAEQFFQPNGENPLLADAMEGSYPRSPRVEGPRVGNQDRSELQSQRFATVKIKPMISADAGATGLDRLDRRANRCAEARERSQRSTCGPERARQPAPSPSYRGHVRPCVFRSAHS